ncbi:MAG: type II toxin-antitoxin system RelE family toxin [Caldilineaceae bacterium]
MVFEIEITAKAEHDLDAIVAYYRSQILDGIEQHLSYRPKQESRSRIKRLRLLDSPAYRLRIGDYRVYYDVDEDKRIVIVLRVLDKEESLRYLEDLENQS